MIINQAYTFIIFIIVGIIIGILFDCFRILRKSINTKDFITYIEDGIFCILTGIVLLYSIFKFNSGEIRIYMFISLIFGCILYMLTISKYFVKINVYMLNRVIMIIKSILNIINIPFKLIKNMVYKVFKPISFVIINIRKLVKIHK